MKTCAHCGIEFERTNANACSTFCTSELKREKRLNGWINAKDANGQSAKETIRKRGYNNVLKHMPSGAIWRRV